MGGLFHQINIKPWLSVIAIILKYQGNHDSTSNLGVRDFKSMSHRGNCFAL